MLMTFEENSQSSCCNFSYFAEFSVGVTTGSVCELEQDAENKLENLIC